MYMRQRFLYSVIALMAAVIIYLLFVPQEPVSAPSALPEPVAEVDAPLPEPEPPVTPQASEDEATVTIEGLFLGLAEEPTEFRKSFYYLLLDDGTEVVRIDLRPILGYELLNPVEKLGVDRGQRVVVTGTMGDSGFTIATIAPAP